MKNLKNSTKKEVNLLVRQFQNGKAIFGDCLETVKTIDTESVDCIITSPPYYQLRDYGFEGQWGNEPTFSEYLDKMIGLMAELKRVLKPTGTMWINLGDSYNNSAQAKNKMFGNPEFNKNRPSRQKTLTPKKNIQQLPAKSLMLIPHRFAIRCIDDLGLILRNDIIWAKPNGLPESVTDRFTKMHEYIFLFTKRKQYFFDLDSIRDPLSDSSITRLSQNITQQTGSQRAHGGMKSNGNLKACAHQKGKNPGDVSDFWAINPTKGNGNHFAAYSSELIRKPVIAGCPLDGVILDPFAGTGTTALAAIRYDRRFIAIEANKTYYQDMCLNIEVLDRQLKLFTGENYISNPNSYCSAGGM